MIKAYSVCKNVVSLFYSFLYFRKAHLSSKKLLEQCQKLEKLWTHVYTGTLNLTSITAESQWYTKLTDLIDKQQTAPIWMSESKVIILKYLCFYKALVLFSNFYSYLTLSTIMKFYFTRCLLFYTRIHRN